MREHLYRGKRIDNGEWVYGSLIDLTERLNEIRICHKRDGYSKDMTPMPYLETKVYPETIGQFTGLCDKNGTKIFEGDIFKGILNGPYEMPYKVIYSPERASFELMTICEFAIDAEKYRLMNYGLEVIGNIHDNPEMLEVANGK